MPQITDVKDFTWKFHVPTSYDCTQCNKDFATHKVTVEYKTIVIGRIVCNSCKNLDAATLIGK